MSERAVKQVIVMRTEFVIDGKKITPRKGKMIAQGAHASLNAFLSGSGYSQGEITIPIRKDSPLKKWVDGNHAKVCVQVKTEEELIDIYNKARAKGMYCSLITDAGLTEFGGVPTKTCCAIGPWWSDEIDEITGNLSLL
jgi:PTH2 family peptidyl-tRNA hydrolase